MAKRIRPAWLSERDSGPGLRFFLTTLLVLALGGLLLLAPRRLAAEKVAPGMPAPELAGGVDWLNCEGPLRLPELRGKVVLLDFWTYCCINCIHVLPDLALLEKKYANRLVVVGVHSAKFEGEKDTRNVRQAVRRYGIAHPVVNDADRKIWTAYGTDAWPTLVLIDPEGNVVDRWTGEGNLPQLDRTIAGLIQLHRQKKTLDERPRPGLADAPRPARPLHFPGKVLADAEGRRLFIADSGHRRVVIVDASGRLLDVAGSGAAGHRDGAFEEAMFNDPQGLALDGDTLYVADRANHLVRALDLEGRTVRTVAGTGKQGTDRAIHYHALRVGLNSPWDLWLEGGGLYIAMAGHHQVWRMNLKGNRIGPFAGTGQEAIRDGDRSVSRFAQPTGLAGAGGWLYVADSETSAVRAVSLKADRSVVTLVGEGLHEFGDVDGAGDQVRLQHCMDVAWHAGKLYVADTYNNKIKVLDPGRRECRTFVGDGQPGATDDPPRFDEPAGLCVAGNLLYVADTNNHAVRVVDLKARAVRTLKLDGVEPPAPR